MVLPGRIRRREGWRFALTAATITLTLFGSIMFGASNPLRAASQTQDSAPVTPLQNWARSIPGGLAGLGGQTQGSVCANPPNLIVAENCKPGSSGWEIKAAASRIDGYAAPMSVNLGETVEFFVNTWGVPFDLAIFRLGYYGGVGARLLKSVPDIKGQTQPRCPSDPMTGLSSCGNWTANYSLTVPTDWVSGAYLAKFAPRDSGPENYTIFTVRDDQRKSAILVQQSTFSFQAYNSYGGKSVYDSASSGCDTVAQSPRAVKISFLRPYVNEPGPTTDEILYDNFFVPEYPILRWLEAQGYDVSYDTTLDTHHSGKLGAPNRLLDHRAFLIVGHDEYWTQEMRDAITAARDHGVHLGIFSSNTAFWRVRLESDPWTGKPESVLVTYKTTESGVVDPSGHPTGTWRDASGVNNPENALFGIQFIGANGTLFFPVRITAEQAKDRIYRNTGLEKMPAGTYIDVGGQMVAWEWDAVVENGKTPPGLQILAASPVYGLLLQDAGNDKNGNLGKAAVHMTRYTAPSGALVFAAGINLWGQGLGGRGVDFAKPDPVIQQVTYNMLADMGAQPGSPDSTLILDGKTAEVNPPGEFIAVNAGHDPVVSDIAVSVKDQTVTFSWKTDTETIGQVWLGEQSEHITYAPFTSTAYTRDHSATIPLSYGRLYHYQIVASDKMWRSTISPDGSFRTENKSLGTQLRDLPRAASKAFQTAQCWAQLNPSAAGGAGGATILVVAIVGWRAVRWRRRRTRPGGVTPNA